MSDNCLTANCIRPAAVSTQRGLCLVCYSRAKKLVETGKTTWDKLVSLGLVTPSGADDHFMKAFNEATEGEKDERRYKGPTTQ